MGRESHARAEKIKGPANPWEEKKGNVLRSKEPAKGIYANIDFESLNKRTSSKRPRSPSNSPPRESNHNESVNKSKEGSSSSSDEGFGPALPPGLKSEVKVEKEVTNITLSSDSDEYKEKKNKKRKKKKHKENKKHRSSDDAVI